MRSSVRFLVVATVAALAVGALAGCVPDDPPPTPAPASTSTPPVFASDEEALAAAEEAFERYLALSDLIGNEGGADGGRISEVASGSLLTSEIDGFAEFASKGWKTYGSTVLVGFTSQTVNLDQSPIVVAYACTDVSGVDVVDASGTSVVSPDRPDQQSLQVSFDLEAGVLLVVELEAWSEGDACGS